MLDLEVLNNCFDDQGRRLEIAKGPAGGDASNEARPHRSGYFALCNPLIQCSGNALDCTLCGFCLRIVEQHGVPYGRRNLSDAGPHGPATHDGNGLIGAERRHRAAPTEPFIGLTGNSAFGLAIRTRFTADPRCGPPGSAPAPSLELDRKRGVARVDLGCEIGRHSGRPFRAAKPSGRSPSVLRVSNT